MWLFWIALHCIENVGRKISSELFLRDSILKVFFKKSLFAISYFLVLYIQVFYGQILFMTPISAKIEFNFCIEIKSGGFCVCVLILCCLFMVLPF